MKDIAIIGAGFSAATLSYFLKKDLIFYEKSRGVGGRCSTRRVDNIGLFDHGLQYIKSKNLEFKNFLGDYRIWEGQFKIFKNNELKEDLNKERIINENGNNTLIKNLFKNKKVFINKELISLDRKNDYFQLNFKDNTQENYKTLIITAPYQQAFNLTKQFTENYFAKLNFSMQPNLTLMVAFNKSLSLNLSAISFEDDDVLGFAANENTKKKILINKDLELWTIQSSLKYAIKNIYEYRNNKKSLMDEMLRSFSVKLKIDIKEDNIQYFDIHGWLYAYSTNLETDNCSWNLETANCYWNEDLRLGICGDWFSGGNAESAFLNAKKLAELI
ncbi:MAG: NAD(P)/FAD-dependent oxidoreductase [Candidatus Fonsibacter sp.]